MGISLRRFMYRDYWLRRFAQTLKMMNVWKNILFDYQSYSIDSIQLLEFNITHVIPNLQY